MNGISGDVNHDGYFAVEQRSFNEAEIFLNRQINVVLHEIFHQNEKQNKILLYKKNIIDILLPFYLTFTSCSISTIE